MDESSLEDRRSAVEVGDEAVSGDGGVGRAMGDANGGRASRVVWYVNFSVLAFGIAAISTSLGYIILPLRVLDVADPALKNTYLGLLGAIGMGGAMLIQPAVGYLSDKTTWAWGRRRPYIALGSLVATGLMVGVGAAVNFIGLLISAVLVQLFINVSQTPYDAMLKDQVPHNQRGKMSSVRAIAGAAGAVLLLLITGFIMDHHVQGERDVWLWISLGLPTGVLAITAVWTLLLVRDDPVAAEVASREGVDSRLRGNDESGGGNDESGGGNDEGGGGNDESGGGNDGEGDGRGVAASREERDVAVEESVEREVEEEVVVEDSAAEEVKPRGIRARIAALGVSRRNLTMLSAAFSYTLAGGILMAYTFYFLQDVVGLEKPASGMSWLAVTAGLAIILTLWPAGVLADRVGRAPLLYVSSALGGGGALLFYLAQNLVHVVLIGIVLGVAAGLFFSAGRALITDMVSENRAALQMGLANFALVGGLAASRLGGPLVDFLNGIQEHSGYYVMLLVCAGAFCMGAFFIYRMMRRVGEVSPPS